MNGGVGRIKNPMTIFLFFFRLPFHLRIRVAPNTKIVVGHFVIDLTRESDRYDAKNERGAEEVGLTREPSDVAPLSFRSADALLREGLRDALLRENKRVQLTEGAPVYSRSFELTSGTSCILFSAALNAVNVRRAIRFSAGDSSTRRVVENFT